MLYCRLLPSLTAPLPIVPNTAGTQHWPSDIAARSRVLAPLLIISRICTTCRHGSANCCSLNMMLTGQSRRLRTFRPAASGCRHSPVSARQRALRVPRIVCVALCRQHEFFKKNCFLHELWHVLDLLGGLHLETDFRKHTPKMPQFARAPSSEFSMNWNFFIAR